MVHNSQANRICRDDRSFYSHLGVTSIYYPPNYIRHYCMILLFAKGIYLIIH
jgi:hypothetical protein